MRVLPRWLGIINLAKPKCPKIGVIPTPEAWQARTEQACTERMRSMAISSMLNRHNSRRPAYRQAGPHPSLLSSVSVWLQFDDFLLNDKCSLNGQPISGTYTSLCSLFYSLFSALSSLKFPLQHPLNIRFQPIKGILLRPGLSGLCHGT